MNRLLSIKSSVASDLDKDVLRQSSDQYASAFNRPYPPGMLVENRKFKADNPERCIAMRIYRPVNRRSESSLVLYFHGGGFVKGDLDRSDTVAWGIAEQTCAIVVSIDYRLAPEHPFPAALEDGYAALQYLWDQGDQLQLQRGRIAVWGDSAGGNIATAVCLLSRDRAGPPIVAQTIHYPCLTDQLTGESYVRFQNGPGLTTAAMDFYWDQYLAYQRPAVNGYAAPLIASDLSGLPPAHVHIAEIDPLADDGRAYVSRLLESGVTANLRTATGMIHGFLRARFDGEQAAREFDAPCKFVRQFLA